MFKLVRLSESKRGTHGVFLYNDLPVCYSLELPYRDNARDISCIPAGSYLAVQERHAHFGRVLRIHDVPDRSGILIHAGNSLRDTRGCILPGLDYSATMYPITQSRSALDRLLNVLPPSETLTIIGV